MIRKGDQREYEYLKKRHSQLRRAIIVFSLLSFIFIAQAFISYLRLSDFIGSGMDDVRLLNQWIKIFAGTTALAVAIITCTIMQVFLMARERDLLKLLKTIVQRENENSEPKH
jgi:type IV secretory pathway VirB2 component (pilin)